MTYKKAFNLLMKYINCWSSGKMCLSFNPESKHDRDLLCALQMARKALDKTIPKKPVFEYESIGSLMCCPSCRGHVYDSDWSNRLAVKYHENFCLHCGQRFTKPLKYLGKWAEEEKEEN